MLAQNLIGQADWPFAYASQILNPTKHNYSTTKLEAVAMILPFYLLGHTFQFIFDHHSLTVLVNQPVISDHLATHNGPAGGHSEIFAARNWWATIH